MDQLYPLEGKTSASCASQDFDFLNYWVDQTVEKEISRGKRLRELKECQSIRNKNYDVIHIGYTNICSKNKRSKCRKKSPAKSMKKRRKNSPQYKDSSTRKLPKNESKSSSHRCSLRIAELSVPSKRQCIDTWRTKYHVLPIIMIDRLRKHVLDLSPIVKIPDAIECFKKHKLMERKKHEDAKAKKMKRFSKKCNLSTILIRPILTYRPRSNNGSDLPTVYRELKKCDNCNDKAIKKPTKVQECRYLCAIFGHKIAKELNKPVQITLNTELQKLSYIVSIEIDKLLCKGNKTSKNQKVKSEVSDKISIWISNILEETAYNILEDQLKDLEEEVGPVLDLIDNLVDNVVDICEPEPVLEASSSSETYNIESSADDGREESQEEYQEESQDDNLSFHDDIPPETEPDEINMDDFIKIELDKIINSFDGEISFDVDDFPDAENQSTENINELKDLQGQNQQNNIEFEDVQDQTQQSNIEFEDIADIEQNEYEDANYTFEASLSKPDTQADAGFLQAEAVEAPLITDQDRDVDSENDLANDLRSEDDSNKKVKFSNINMVTTEDITDLRVGAQIIPEQVNPIQFFALYDGLLVNTDEPWPEELSPPILRPSESVSKSINSLGNILEADEKISIMLEDDAKTKRTVNYTIVDENNDQIDGIRIWNNDAKTQAILSDPRQLNDDEIINDTNYFYTNKNHRSSTESTYNHDIPTESLPYKQTLFKILEEQGTQVASSDKTLEHTATQVIMKQESCNVATNTVGAQTADKSTSIASQSLGNITNCLRGVKADEIFSSLRIKPKVDYKVHKNFAPPWVTQNFGEPSDSSQTTPQYQEKKSNDKNIRLWCKDLENGFDNLELWNGWIQNALKSVNTMEIMKARICIDKSREEFVRDWLHLKKDVDADVLTWTKLSKSTQEKMKGFRKIYQNLETPPPPNQNKYCNCHS